MQLLQCYFAVFRAFNHITALGELFHQHVTKHVVVLDDEDLFRVHISMIIII